MKRTHLVGAAVALSLFAQCAQATLFGSRKVFSEVGRTVAPSPGLADYIVSGTYDYSKKTSRGFTTHTITIKGTIHLRLVRAKDNVPILEKDFVEERSDETKVKQAAQVHYLQAAYIHSITAEIKNCVAQDAQRSQAKAQ